MKKSSSLPNLLSSSVIVNAPLEPMDLCSLDPSPANPFRLLSHISGSPFKPADNSSQPARPMNSFRDALLDLSPKIPNPLENSEVINGVHTLPKERTAERQSSAMQSLERVEKSRLIRSSNKANLDTLLYKKSKISYSISESEKNDKLEKILLLNEVFDGNSMYQNKVLIPVLIIAFILGLNRMYSLIALSARKDPSSLFALHASAPSKLLRDSPDPALVHQKISNILGHHGNLLRASDDPVSEPDPLFRQIGSSSMVVLGSLVCGCLFALLTHLALGWATTKREIQAFAMMLAVSLAPFALARYLPSWTLILADSFGVGACVGLLLLALRLLRSVSAQSYFDTNSKHVFVFFGLGTCVALLSFFASGQLALWLQMSVVLPLFLSTVLPRFLPGELQSPALHSFYLHMAHANHVPFKRSHMSHLMNFSYAETVKLRVHLQNHQIDIFQFMKLFSFVSSDTTESTIDSLSDSFQMKTSKKLSLNESLSTDNSLIDSFNSFGRLGRHVISKEVPSLSPILQDFSGRFKIHWGLTKSTKSHSSTRSPQTTRKLSHSVKSLPQIRFDQPVSESPPESPRPALPSSALKPGVIHPTNFNPPQINVVFHERRTSLEFPKQVPWVYRLLSALRLAKTQHKIAYLFYYSSLFAIVFLAIFGVVLDFDGGFGVSFRRELLLKLALITLMLLCSHVFAFVLSEPNWVCIRMVIFTLGVLTSVLSEHVVQLTPALNTLNLVLVLLCLGAIMSLSDPHIVAKIIQPSFSFGTWMVLLAMAGIFSMLVIFMTSEDNKPLLIILAVLCVVHLIGFNFSKMAFNKKAV